MIAVTLDEALAQWSSDLGQARFHVIGPLSGGLTNSSYCVDCGGRPVVVRLNNPNSHDLGICRQSEQAVLRALAPLQVAPNILYSDANHRFTVLEYLEGSHPSEQQWQSLAFKAQLQALVTRYQTCFVDIQPFDYHAHLAAYWQLIRHKHPKKASQWQDDWLRFEPQLVALQNSVREPVLVHHDLNRMNVIQTDQGLRVIDWEYAGIGFRELDLISMGAPLSKEHTVFFSQLSYFLIEFWSLLQS